MNRIDVQLLAVLLLLAISAAAVAAANDPGHDTLYVLKIGDSNVTGSINITSSLNASYIRAATLLYGDQLDIRANGTIQTVSSRPAVQSDTNDLYLDAKTNLYLNTRGGTTNIVQVGPTSGSSITLNVSGAIRQQGVAVCLSNGTNCPSSLSGSNVTGSGNTGYLARWTSASNVGNSVIYDDGTNVGIGTASPSHKLHVVGAGTVKPVLIKTDTDNHFTLNTTAISGDIYALFQNTGDGDNAWAIGRTNSGTFVIYHSTGSAFATGTSTQRLTIDTDGDIGIGTTTPAAKLDVNGSINVSGASAKVYTPELCLAGNCQTSWPSGADGTGGWTNTSTTTSTALNVNVTTGNLTVVSGNAGIGTAAPSGKLHVYGDSQVSYGVYDTPLRIQGDSYTYLELVGASSQAGLVLNRDGSTGWFTGINNDGKLRIADLTSINQAGLTNAKDGVEGITVQTDGNVGIGTTTPAYILHVNTSTNTLIAADTSSSSAQVQLNLRRNNVQKAAIYLDANNDLAFAGPGGALMLLNTSSGSFGVGTATPEGFDVRGLTVSAASQSADSVRLGRSATGRSTIILDSSNTTYTNRAWFIENMGGEGKLYIGRNGLNAAVIDNDGNIGVGTTAPSTMLHLNDATNTDTSQITFSYTSGSVIDTHTIGRNSATGLLEFTALGNNNGFKFNSSAGASHGDFVVTNMDVGIGTAAPTQKLDVNGSLNISGASAKIYTPELCLAGNCQTSWAGGGAGNITGSGTANYITKWQNSTNLGSSIIYDNSTHVGIGTAAPRGKFDVDGTGDIYLADDTTAGTSQSVYLPGHIYISPYASTNISYLQARRSDDSGTTSLRLRTWNAGVLTEAMHIEGSGNVGIGTTNPGAKLDVNGSTLVGKFTGSSTDVYIQLVNNAASAHSWQFTATKGSADGSGFAIRDTTAGAARMVIDEAGDIGIGTTDPLNKLQVEGSVALASAYNTMGAGERFIGIPGSGATWSGAGSYIGFTQGGTGGVSNDIRFYTHKSGVSAGERMRIDEAGSVGIGTASPTQKLDVNGSINASGPGNIYYQGNLTGYGADLAEMVFGENLEAGDVVILDPDTDEGVTLASAPYDTRVAGIISTDPSHLMSADEGDVPLALAGRVPVKVTDENGMIRRGDLLTTSSTPGHAMRCADRAVCSGAIVGKAMENQGERNMITALVVLG